MKRNIDRELNDEIRRLGRHMREGRMFSCAAAEKRTVKEKNSLAKAFQRERILDVLSERPDGMRQKELADYLQISSSTLSEMIHHLVADGYVEQHTLPEDRRVQVLTLTEKGTCETADINTRHVGVIRHVFRNLETGDKQELIRLIRKMIGE
ncbi:MAG: MarR family transcriptional regulator [Solobacterium sp.]|nr:MarR family transcriptional regulator [Solobacterium sp.]